MRTDNSYQSVTDAYLQCALWADADSVGGSEFATISEQARAQAEAVCDAFLAAVEADKTIPATVFDDYSDRFVGHDLWLTAAGHGAGFWDGRYQPETIGRKLAEIAQTFPMHLEFSADGEILEAIR